MGKSSGDSNIPQIDPSALVQQQAQANRISQFGPQGNLIFGNIGSNGQFNPSTGQAAAVVEESPFNQRYRMGNEDLALTAQNLAAPRVFNLPAAPIDTTNLPGFRSSFDWSKIDRVPSSNDFSADATAVEKATFDRAMGLLNPQFEKQENRLDQTLANRGIPMGSEAYTGAQTDFRRARDEALNKAALDAVAAGRAEQSRLFGQALTGHQAGLGDQTAEAQLANTTRAQQVQEQQALRTGNLQEIAAMLGIAPVSPVEAKSFFGPSPVDVTGPASLQQQSAIAAANRNAQNQNALYQGIGALGSAAIGALALSDRRLKTDVERVGKTDDGLTIYTYKLFGEGPTRMGIMADELREKNPSAVVRLPSGVDAVDYSKISDTEKTARALRGNGDA